MKTAKQAPEPAHGHPHQPLGLYVGMHSDIPAGCALEGNPKPNKAVAVGAHVGHPCRSYKGNECGCQTKAPGGGTPAKAEAQAQAQGQAARRRQGGMSTSWCCLRWRAWWGRSGERGADDKRAASLERAEGGQMPGGGGGAYTDKKQKKMKIPTLVNVKDQPLVVGPINGSCSSLRMIAHAVFATIHDSPSEAASKASQQRSQPLSIHSAPCSLVMPW
jgi:hypothetical protein